MPRLEQVFGISSKPVLSYTARPEVDGRFLDAVKSDHHIVVYGASKQGKTALRQKHIPEAQYQVYACSPRTDPTAIYQYVLHEAGIRIQTIETKADLSSLSAKASFGVKASIPWLGEVSGGTEGGGQQQTEDTNDRIRRRKSS